jgi:hypothetical protein
MRGDDMLTVQEKLIQTLKKKDHNFIVIKSVTVSCG